ncbi:transaldolase [Leeia sp. TBRC 13508]|uniref:Transaldolase n=1 Tax=Leeia speluncae TaxID=2884804 RepID=A0ABS8D680_9NEIS|nr:transaldolase [Leeia speluncae]MCB6183523.1 transaldolase [Leeia speluncae]
MSRLAAISQFGQQVWLDNLSRHLIETGRLAQWLNDDAIAGVTSNPAIFYNAISKDAAYQSDLARLKTEVADPERRFELLVLPDVRATADLLAPLYASSQADKGYVSFEVSPTLANDAEGTVAAAQRLWAEIGKPNAMIKIPATKAGIVAIEESIAAGININVTLMFSPQHVTDVFGAYIRGLQRRADAGLPIDQIRSVASIFISRVDTLIDKLLPESEAALQGKIAIAAAKAAYITWQETFGGEAFAALRAKGARPQTPLWASTGTKNPAYRDVMYVEELIGAETVNTVPDATLAAFADHGEARSSLAENLDVAVAQLAALKAAGIDLNQAGEQLQQEGLKQFDEAFEKLIALVK